MHENLATILTETVKRHGDGTAFKVDEVELSYALLDEASARIAGLLKENGVAEGDRVGPMLPDGPYFPVIYYGILRGGGVVVPMTVLLKEREVRFYLDDPGARLLFAWHGFAEAAEDGAADARTACLLVRPGEFWQLLASQEPVHAMAERAGGDTAMVLYTSGTTGTPKGAELTHANLRRNCTIVTEKLGGFSEEDVLLGSAAAGARARPAEDLHGQLVPQRRRGPLPVARVRREQPRAGVGVRALRRQAGGGDPDRPRAARRRTRHRGARPFRGRPRKAPPIRTSGAASSRGCGSTSPRLATSCPTSSRPSWTHWGVGSTRPAETTSARGQRA